MSEKISLDSSVIKIRFVLVIGKGKFLFIIKHIFLLTKM